MGNQPDRKTVLLHLRMEDQLFNGIIDECRQLSWQVVNLEYTSDYIPSGRTYVGAIFDDSLKDIALKRLLELRIPIVLAVDDEREFLRGMPKVLPDWYGIGQLAAGAFAERGFKHIGLVVFDGGGPDHGLLDGLTAGVSGISSGNVHVCRLDNEDGLDNPLGRYGAHVHSICDWFKSIPVPVGIFAFNHRMGARIITAAEMAGLSVPEQVAVLAAGNHPAYCETAPVPLSAIDRNEVVRGKLLVRQLKAMVDGERPPDRPIVVAPAGITERRSTDILAVPDTRVALAIRFMWDHLDWPITVDDVALQVGTSRTTLERDFRKHLGRGVIGELRRKRLERCKELLRATDLTIPEITKAIGLNDKRYLHRAFKDTFGETPHQYRMRRKNQQINDSNG